mmetsp:Transcript_57082/g.129338  ORF Transcript_57082/g.129338 Transcript_57082/m.129338 type:complete len:236 (+) Transcript_57082:273-980(+)
MTAAFQPPAASMSSLSTSSWVLILVSLSSSAKASLEACSLSRFRCLAFPVFFQLTSTLSCSTSLVMVSRSAAALSTSKSSKKPCRYRCFFKPRFRKKSSWARSSSTRSARCFPARSDVPARSREGSPPCSSQNPPKMPLTALFGQPSVVHGGWARAHAIRSLTSSSMNRSSAMAKLTVRRESSSMSDSASLSRSPSSAMGRPRLRQAHSAKRTLVPCVSEDTSPSTSTSLSTSPW